MSVIPPPSGARPRLRLLEPRVLVWPAAVGLSLALGAGLSSGSTRGYLGVALIVGAVVGAAVAIAVSELEASLLFGWIAISGIAYPFLRHGPITFDRVATGVILGALLIRRARVEHSGPTRRLFLALGAFAVWVGARTLLTTHQSFDPTNRATDMAIWVDGLVLPGVILVAASRVIVTTERLRQVAAALMVSGVAVSIIGIAEKMTGFELASRSGGSLRLDAAVEVVRISGPYSVPEAYAVVLLVCFGATLYWTIVRGPRFYALGTVALGLEAAAIGITFFRAAWIAGIVILVFGLGIRPRRYARTVGVLALLLAFGFAAYSELRQSTKFEERVHNTENVESRFATWGDAIGVAGGSPWIGVGTQRYSAVHTPDVTSSVNGVEAAPSAHSSYLTVLAEQGAIGFLGLLAVSAAVFGVMRSLFRRAKDRADVVFASVAIGIGLGYLLMSLTLTMLPYGPSNAFFAVIVGAVCGRLDALRAVPAPARR